MSYEVTASIAGKRIKLCDAEDVASGCYSTVYFNGNEVFIVTSWSDLSKKIMSDVPKTRHLPNLELLGMDCEGRYIFKAPKYKKFDYFSGTDEHRKIYDELCRLDIIARDCCSSPRYKAFAAQLESSTLPESVRTAVKVLIEAIEKCKATVICLDIGERNLMVDANGDLILNDIFVVD